MSYSVVAFGWDEGSGVFQPMWGLLNTMAEGYLTPAGRVFLFWPLLQIGSSDHGPQSHIHSSIRTSQPRQGQGSYQRTTFRDLANALGAKSILYNLFKEGYFRRQNNDLNFSLIDENKKTCVWYCLSMMNVLFFKPMINIVYIDEKQVYRTRRNQKYYLTLMSKDLNRLLKTKKHRKGYVSGDDYST
jgi:hypothetical protein